MTEPLSTEEALEAVLTAHDGMQRLIRVDGLPAEAVDTVAGFMGALAELGFTLIESASLATQEADTRALREENERLHDLLRAANECIASDFGPDGQRTPWEPFQRIVLVKALLAALTPKAEETPRG